VISALALILLLIATISDAATWRVAQDGSGDFAIIQDAVDAAAPGDTVSIGPGRYLDSTLFQSDSSNTELANVAIAKDRLTLVGDARDDVVIGPSTLDFHAWGIAMLWDGASDLTVSGLTVVNAREGLRAFGPIHVEDVRFLDCYWGIAAMHRSQGEVVDCEFRRIDDSEIVYAGLVVESSQLLVVRNCDFLDGGNGIQSANYGRLEILDSRFQGGRGGFVQGASPATVRGCVFRDMSNFAIAMQSRMGALTVENNEIHSTNVALAVYSDSPSTIRNNVIRGGSETAIYVYADKPGMVVSHNHIVKGSGHAVEVQPYYNAPFVTHLDFSENWWGSSNAENIATWIWDANDDQDIHAFVDFDPPLDHPVSTETSSIGRLKATYGGSE